MLDNRYTREWAALLPSKFIKKGTLKFYRGARHGRCSTHKDHVNADLRAFFKA